mmetsp:Transcript_11202/g.23601  ORF Transcript_11202/g.23601 Transcript_11202/m.23601 type:complete len:233 (-) Transcript_11202:570-1268(-)
MLTQTEINHLQFAIRIYIREEEILQFQIAVNDSLEMNVSNGAEHLLDESGTLGLGVVVVGLFVEAIEQFSTLAYLLNKIDFGVRFVDFFETDNVGMIQLTHNINLFLQLLQPLFRINHRQIQTLDGVIHLSSSMLDQPDDPRNPTPQNRPIVNALVHFLDRFPQRNFDADEIGVFTDIANDFGETDAGIGVADQLGFAAGGLGVRRGVFVEVLVGFAAGGAVVVGVVGAAIA